MLKGLAQRIKLTGMLSQIFLLLFLGVLSIFLSAFRVFFTEKMTFVFLNWNLFLAAIPWGITAFLKLWPSLQRKWVFSVPLLTVWLLFFPNGPYILTDLFHLKERSNLPLWFDFVLILCYSWTGIVFAFLSLIDLEGILANVFRSRCSGSWVPFFSSTYLFFCAYGIFLGRFLRWNSWDVLHYPGNVLYDILLHVRNPTQYPDVWAMTALMGLLLNGMYFTFKCMRKIEVVH